MELLVQPRVDQVKLLFGPVELLKSQDRAVDGEIIDNVEFTVAKPRFMVQNSTSVPRGETCGGDVRLRPRDKQVVKDTTTLRIWDGRVVCTPPRWYPGR